MFVEQPERNVEHELNCVASFKEWNKIPLDIRNSETVGIFKNSLHRLM